MVDHFRRRLMVGAAAALAAASFEVRAQERSVPIRIAVPTADDDPTGIAANHFAKRMQELAGAAANPRVFSRGVLGNESAALENTIGGNIDVLAVSNTVLSSVVPDLTVLDIPYGLSGPDHAWKVLDGEIGKHFADRIAEKGLRIVGWAYAGSRCLMFRNKAVRSVADLAQMKLRVPANQIYADAAKAWGANPTTVPWPEVYLALSQGVVDGIETAPGPSFDQKHYEVAKYLVRSDHLVYFYAWLISEKSWRSWPERVRTAALTAGNEAALLNRRLRLEQEKGVYDEFAKRGVTVIEPNRSEFAQKLRPVQDGLKADLQPLLQRIRAVQ